MQGSSPSSLERLPLLKDRPGLALVCTLAICAIVLAARLLTERLLPPGYPLFLFLPGVVLAALLYGVHMGIVATVISTLLAWSIFPGSFEQGLLDPYSGTISILYLITVSMMLALIYWIHRSTARLVAERERNARLAETRELLFRELQHRVSNNLQVAASLISLQRGAVADQAARHALDEASLRLAVIGGISRQLYDPGGAPRPLQTLLEPLCADVVRASGHHQQIRLTVHVPSGLSFPPETALPLALVVAEAVANAIEHGFAHRPGGAIDIGAHCRDEALTIEVHDDGNGLPPGFDLKRNCGLGLRIARMFAEQLGGRFELVPENGTTARLLVPWRSASAEG